MPKNNVFKYPSDIDTGNSPYCIISAFPYKFKLQKDAEDMKMADKLYRFHFISHIPKDTNYSNAPQYKGLKTLGLTGAIFDDNARTQGWFRTASEALMGGLDTVLEGISTGTGLNQAYKTIKDQGSIGLDAYVDPRMVNVYSEPDFLNQTLNFTLLPNDKDEAEKISLLVNVFKYAGLPQRLGGKIEDFEAYPILQSPLIFDIGYYTKQSTYLSLMREYTWMNLVSINAKFIYDSSRSDTPFYKDDNGANAFGYELSLVFKSMHSMVRPTGSLGDDNSGIIKSALDIVNYGTKETVSKDQTKVI